MTRLRRVPSACPLAIRFSGQADPRRNVGYGRRFTLPSTNVYPISERVRSDDEELIANGLAQVDGKSSAMNSSIGLSKRRWMSSGIAVVFARGTNEHR